MPETEQIEPRFRLPKLSDVMDEHPDYYDKAAFEAFYESSFCFYRTYSDALDSWLGGNRDTNDVKFAHSLELLKELRASLQSGLISESHEQLADHVRTEKRFQSRHAVSEDDERRAFFCNRETSSAADYEARFLKSDYSADERLRMQIHEQLKCASQANKVAVSLISDRFYPNQMSSYKAAADWSANLLMQSQEQLKGLKKRDDMLEASRACVALGFEPLRLD